MTEYLPLPRSATSKPHNKTSTSLPLSGWRELDAYVLLGEPGAGKTTVFRQEAEAQKGVAVFVTARDFLTLGPPYGWRDEILFIDAVDERQAASDCATAPLDGIRKKLFELGRPRFRLSCREADWLAGGTKDLCAVAPEGKVEELWLDLLCNADIAALLRHWGFANDQDINAFREMAYRRNMEALLRNPMLLNMLVEAVRKNDWPASRSETYELACKQMASEHNLENRRAAKQAAVPIEQCLEAAGKLCALLLLSDAQYLSFDLKDHGGEVIQIDELPKALGLEFSVLRATVNSTLFGAEGERRMPRHRTIAEYLGARAIAALVTEHGLPIQRVRALLTGHDGGVVEPLRGLYGWLTFHCVPERELLIGADPLGLVLYGDVKPFSTCEKRWVLEALQRAAARFPWFHSSNRNAHPFGALGTVDMEPAFWALFSDPSREIAHQSVLDCVVNAIHYGEPMPGMAQVLEAVIRDASYGESLRNACVAAWVKTLPDDGESGKALLEDIRTGKVIDADDELTGHLLIELYPKRLSPDEALLNLYPGKLKRQSGAFWRFWDEKFIESIPCNKLGSSLDFMYYLLFSKDDQELKKYSDEFVCSLREIGSKLLAQRFLEMCDSIGDDKLYRWLDYRVISYSDTELIKDWLSSHPAKLKSLYLIGANYLKLHDSENIYGPPHVNVYLLNPKLPIDWFQWLLNQAAESTNAGLVKNFLTQATRAAINSQDKFDISLDDIDAWIELHVDKWPKALDWKLEVSSMSMDCRECHDYKMLSLFFNGQRKKKEHLQQKIAIAIAIAPALEAVFVGTASSGLMGDLPRDYIIKKISCIIGRRPVDRVMDFFMVSEAEAVKSIHGLKAVLQRSNLPTAAEIEAIHLTEKNYLIGPACQLAAELTYADDPSVVMSWSEQLIETLVAFHLINGGGQKLDWFDALCRTRPNTVAPVLKRIAVNNIQNFESPYLRMQYHLWDEHTPKALAAQVIPCLIRAIPAKPSKYQLGLLDRALIPVAMHHLSLNEFRMLIEERLADCNISVELQISLHIAGLQFEVDKNLAALDKLSKIDSWVGFTIREILDVQKKICVKLAASSPSSIGGLIEILAVHAVETGDPSSIEPVESPCRSKRDAIKNLANILSEESSFSAGQELRRLQKLEVMGTWSIELHWCIYNQEHLARLAAFRSPPAMAVAGMLLNKAPVNPRDMAALIIDQLRGIAQRIRFEETNQLDLFWEPDDKEEDKKKRKRKPKTENECRDILHSLLRDRLLKIGVQIEKESFAAGDKRADLQGSTIANGERIVVPIEIKKENHTGVWSAWWDQLEARYTNNPAAKGIGIYLVLWFGDKPKKSPAGVMPRTAEHMAQLFSENIPADRWNKIHGLVIDLSLVAV